LLDARWGTYRVDEGGGGNTVCEHFAHKAQVARRAAAPQRDVRRRAVGLANYFDIRMNRVRPSHLSARGRAVFVRVPTGPRRKQLSGSKRDARGKSDVGQFQYERGFFRWGTE